MIFEIKDLIDPNYNLINSESDLSSKLKQFFIYENSNHPEILENNLEKLISVEEKYYSFSKYGMTVNLVPYQLSMLDEFFSNLNPDAVVFAGGYRMYTDEIKNFEKKY